MGTTNKSTTLIYDSQKTYEVTIGNRTLTKDDLVRLKGRTGWFRFKWERKGDLTFWGPCNKQGTTLPQAQFVSVTEGGVK